MWRTPGAMMTSGVLTRADERIYAAFRRLHAVLRS
jgi:hypothetical protein